MYLSTLDNAAKISDIEKKVIKCVTHITPPVEISLFAKCLKHHVSKRNLDSFLSDKWKQFYFKKAHIVIKTSINLKKVSDKIFAEGISSYVPNNLVTVILTIT